MGDLRGTDCKENRHSWQHPENWWTHSNSAVQQKKQSFPGLRNAVKFWRQMGNPVLVPLLGQALWAKSASSLLRSPFADDRIPNYKRDSNMEKPQVSRKLDILAGPMHLWFPATCSCHLIATISVKKMVTSLAETSTAGGFFNAFFTQENLASQANTSLRETNIQSKCFCSPFCVGKKMGESFGLEKCWAEILEAFFPHSFMWTDTQSYYRSCSGQPSSRASYHS